MTNNSSFSTAIVAIIVSAAAFVVFKLVLTARQILALRAANRSLDAKASVSAPRFNIAQVTINEHGPIFEEIIIALQAAFSDLNIPCTRTENVFVDDAINILVGATMFVSEQVTAALAGKSYVLYQMEQLDSERGFLPNFPQYIGLLKNALCVWDYSQTNIEWLTQIGVSKVVYVPIGFHPAIEVLKHDQPKDIDVLFYGAMTPHRDAILRALAERGVAVKALFGCYGKERDAAIIRAKIVLNVHGVAIGTLEEVRLSYLLANHCFVVSENADHNPYGGGVVFCTYDQLVETCVGYLAAGDETRQKIAEIGYQAIRKIDYTGYIRLAVQQTVVSGAPSISKEQA